MTPGPVFVMLVMWCSSLKSNVNFTIWGACQSVIKTSNFTVVYTVLGNQQQSFVTQCQILGKNHRSGVQVTFVLYAHSSCLQAFCSIIISFTKYCLSQWISTLPGSYDIYWVRQCLSNYTGLVGIENSTVYKMESIFTILGLGKFSWFFILLPNKMYKILSLRRKISKSVQHFGLKRLCRIQIYIYIFNDKDRKGFKMVWPKLLNMSENEFSLGKVEDWSASI